MRDLYFRRSFKLILAFKRLSFYHQFLTKNCSTMFTFPIFILLFLKLYSTVDYFSLFIFIAFDAFYVDV